VRAVHERTGRALAEDLEVERSFIGRTAGLMFRRRLEPGHGMWILDCNGIHMMFMNFAIDAVFLDGKERVRKVYRNLPAWWGVVWFVWGAHSVLELPAGSTAGIDLQRGDQILL
jgi:uncharacterized membrane protein (UPF0127 family)